MSSVDISQLQNKIWDAEKNSFNHYVIDMLQDVHRALQDLELRVNALDAQSPDTFMQEVANLSVIVTDV